MQQTNATPPSAKVVSVQDDLVEIQLDANSTQRLMKNEVIYICPKTENEQPVWLKAEVLRVRHNCADAQVYESTHGVAVGDPVVQTGQMLSVTLGPGLLGQVFDGLQTPLPELASQFGTFLPRGVQLSALNQRKKWAFTPTAKAGSTMRAGDAIGTIQEGKILHKIMLPFHWRGSFKLEWIQEGAFTVTDVVARVSDPNNRTHDVTLSQSWPVRKPLNQALVKGNSTQRLYPTDPLLTGQRLIDTFFPIARGGTACIPGPFGAGKTVLQNLISRYADVDVVIIVACGERAGEVVETITEFPQLPDPQGNGSLMDRTIIICNTSSMPVAAREASIYTGITVGEYYQQMGLDVLIIADSTSRWAQAMRETSGRLEEIPGEEGFPAYLESSIKSVYERAGSFKTNDGTHGSLTLIGTVSPAGGNFDEPVTQATLATVKCFLGLSSERAYKRFYPAVDPLNSWSRYREQLDEWFDEHQQSGWSDSVEHVIALIKNGQAVLEMMQVTGEDGVTLEDFVQYLKGLFVDMVYLQQDAFDPVDAACSLDRQKQLFNLILEYVDCDYSFADKQEARQYFTALTGKFKNLNYTKESTPTYRQLLDALQTRKG
ncbi:V-type ATP synthase subunit A [Alteromonas sp. ASW11-36]|uniref:V-type ATP synthase alpha chain n=1 Tax=Alteromonas arenosi TaxID=3055817 RepID=A0ABT7SUF1_9ALTE|nr:V-type ATP synthase subunit A [Alteromonas sp. ASW11-36]MDM7859823.1 V-type ATP synthase subunit A [Alteromonas sp. ASW11-36]